MHISILSRTGLKKTAVPALALILVLGVLAFPRPALSAGTPEEALLQAQRGIDEANSDLFTSVVDVASVVNNASTALIATLKEQAIKGDMGDGSTGMLLTLAAAADDSGSVALLQPLLVSEVKSLVAAGINGGYFGGKPNGSVKPSKASLTSVLKKLPEGRREIVPGKILSEEGGKARMAATFVDPKEGRFPLELLLERRGDNWRVVEIVNARELFNEAAKRNK